MRKNLHHKIMLSILAGSLALGFVYAPLAFAEDVLIADTSYTAPDGTRGTYDLDAEGTTAGTNYGNAEGYKPITLPTDDIDTFTVTAGKGGTSITSWSTGGNGGSISLSDINNAINKVSITAGNGGDIIRTDDAYTNITSGRGGDVTLTFEKAVTGGVTATGGNGSNAKANDNANYLFGGNGGNVNLTFDGAVEGDITATAGNGGDTKFSDIVTSYREFFGGDVNLTFRGTVKGDINATGGNGGNAKFDAIGEYHGGNGGNVELTFTGAVTGDITATAGNSGKSEIKGYVNNFNGNNGGDVTLTFNNVVFTDSISLASGINTEGAHSDSKGGSVTFEAESISGTQSKDSSGSTTTSNIDINLTKNDGDITFDVGTLNIADNTVKITAKDNSSNSNNNGENNIVIAKTGQNHIDNLI